jgi:hypothetical protein
MPQGKRDVPAHANFLNETVDFFRMLIIELLCGLSFFFLT